MEDVLQHRVHVGCHEDEKDRNTDGRKEICVWWVDGGWRDYGCEEKEIETSVFKSRRPASNNDPGDYIISKSMWRKPPTTYLILSHTFRLY